MKKASKFLSMFLALAMAFALAVPAFADGFLMESLADVGCDYTVPPIGTVRVCVSGAHWEEYSVFDQAVTFTLKNGGRFTNIWDPYSAADDIVVNQDGTATFPADAEGLYWFGVEREGEHHFFGACSKSYLDKVIAENALWYSDQIEYIPNDNPASPTQPSTPSQPVGPGTPSTTTVAKPAPGVSVPLNDGSGEFLYTIKSGDTLTRIAAYYYGDANVYKLIYERNKDILKDADTNYAGQVITLPSYAAVAQFRAAAQQPAVAKPAPGVSVPLNDGSGEFLYTVRSGDSLSRIAAYYYGDANVYKLIYARNKDTLPNANMIYAGQTIILPSYAAVAAFKAAAK